MVMSKKTILIIGLVFIAITGGFAIWKVVDAKAKTAKLEAEMLRSLTKEDLVMVLKSQEVYEPERIGGIVNSPESRKAFLRGIKEHLALAASARREGMADDPNFKLNMQIKERRVLADLYFHKLNEEWKRTKKEDEKEPPFIISKEQLAAVWDNPENEKLFNEEREALMAVQHIAAKSMNSEAALPLPASGERLEKPRKIWARNKIFADMAKADAHFMNDRTTQLRLKILEAGILSANYLAKYWVENIKVTKEDVRAYLAAHPEYDVRKKLEKAEMVLQRAKAGEDLAMLAKEYSEDRSTKDNGGLYEEWQKGGGLWPEVEAAALALKKGQIAERLIETKDGFHIVQLVDKKEVKEEDGTEITKLSIRHVLLQRRFESTSPNTVFTMLPPPFKTPEEIAKDEIEKNKKQKFIDQIISREKIVLPEDFDYA
jgi:hypothetical protein